MKKITNRKPLLLALMLGLTVFSVFGPTLNALGDERKPGIQSNRSKKIDFEGETVEGVNSNLDSLNQLARRDRKNDPHLYRKREHFRDETDQTVMDLGVRP